MASSRMAFQILLGSIVIAELVHGASMPVLSCFKKDAQTALYGHNDKRYYGKTVVECASACLSETAFKCLSFDYMAGQSLCFLSASNRLSAPVMIGSHHASDHYTLKPQCEDTEVDGDDGDDGSSGSGSGSGSWSTAFTDDEDWVWT